MFTIHSIKKQSLINDEHSATYCTHSIIVFLSSNHNTKEKSILAMIQEYLHASPIIHILIRKQRNKKTKIQYL